MPGLGRAVQQPALHCGEHLTPGGTPLWRAPFQGGQHPEVRNDYVSSQLFMFKLNCVQPTKENYLFVKVDVFLPKRETFTVGCCGDKGGRPGYGWVFLLTADLLTVLGVSVEPPVAPSTPGISTI